MKHLLFLHWQSARRALAGFIRQPLGSFLTLLLLAVALSMPLALYLSVKGLADWTQQLAATPEITLFMETGADTTDLRAVETALKQHPGVDKVTFVPRDLALKDLLARHQLDGLQDGLEGNPLPDAFIVTPKAQPARALDSLQRELSGLPLVEITQFDAAWATKLDALLRFARHGLWSLGAALALALILVTHNTIRLQVLARRDEIEVSKLIGATDDFIRRPVLYHALWQGVFAALIAWGLSYWFVQAASPALADLAALYGARTTLAPLGLAEGGILVLCSALLCMLGARLAASHHLRQLAPR